MSHTPNVDRVRITGTVELAEWPEVNAVVGVVAQPEGQGAAIRTYYVENTGKGRDLTSYLGEEVTVVGLLRRFQGGAAVLRVSRYLVPGPDAHGLDPHPLWRRTGRPGQTEL